MKSLKEKNIKTGLEKLNSELRKIKNDAYYGRAWSLRLDRFFCAFYSLGFNFHASESKN